MQSNGMAVGEGALSVLGWESEEEKLSNVIAKAIPECEQLDILVGSSISTHRDYTEGAGEVTKCSTSCFELRGD